MSIKNILTISLFFVSSLSFAQVYPSLKSLVLEVDYYSSSTFTELFTAFNKQLSQTFELDIDQDLNRIENEVDIENYLIALSSQESKIRSKLEDYGISVNMDIYLSDFYISSTNGYQYSMVVEQSYYDSLSTSIIKPFGYHRDNSGKVRISGIKNLNCNSSNDINEGDEIVKINSYPVRLLPNGLINTILNTNRKIELELKSSANDSLKYKVFESLVNARPEPILTEVYQNSTLIVKLNSFLENGDTSKLLNTLSQSKDNIEKVILDLRNFEGGVFQELINLVDFFTKKNSEIVRISTFGKEIEKRKSIYSPVIKNAKILVLINNGTSSGANVVAGALKFNNIGFLIGEKTTPQNSLQLTRPLHNYNYFAKIVIGNFFFGVDKSLYENGISPDNYIKDCVTSEEDSILDYALSYD
ncbi:S41 family peptidase [Fulvivirga lutea]|uniref:Tail specific protease domain-containing protein n=1 Tax=Fulvivirga lutea TaxID=2810512 RepID=A0A974WJL0_9BACT|nr:S41 family peptidase [Fulvivirga lutea]QSE98978.1 hypothetical protein JR347_07805 [Fulvivirga lutea]